MLLFETNTVQNNKLKSPGKKKGVKNGRFLYGTTFVFSPPNFDRELSAIARDRKSVSPSLKIQHLQLLYDKF